MTPRERIRDNVAAAYEIARAGLCINAIRDRYRTPKHHAHKLRAAIIGMHQDHLMSINRIARVLNRDRATVRYHLRAGE